jgi:hypothetical protein
VIDNRTRRDHEFTGTARLELVLRDELEILAVHEDLGLRDSDHVEEVGLDRTTPARRLFALDAPATGACMLGFAMYKIGELARAD